jgi:hypothetical protein
VLGIGLIRWGEPHLPERLNRSVPVGEPPRG